MDGNGGRNSCNQWWKQSRTMIRKNQVEQYRRKRERSNLDQNTPDGWTIIDQPTTRIRTRMETTANRKQ